MPKTFIILVMRRRVYESIKTVKIKKKIRGGNWHQGIANHPGTSQYVELFY